MDEVILYRLLQKQRDNTLSPGEATMLDEWYYQLNHLPDKKVNFSKSSAGTWKVIAKRLSLERSHYIIGYRYAAAAAIIGAIITIAIWIGRENKPGEALAAQWQTVKAPAGNRLKVTLPDRSVVWLNGGASLSYPKGFDSTRNVYLHEGEAFFEITKDAAHPFYVHSDRLHTQVLGTSFDIRYNGGKYMIGIATGRVKVYYTAKDHTTKILANALTPGQRLYTDSTASQPVTDQINMALLNGWATGGYRLQNATLSDIIFCMESMYGVSIRVNNPSLLQQRFTTRFSAGDRIEKVMERLALSGGFQYTIKGRNISIH